MIDKVDLMTSRVAKGQHVHGVGHDGAPRAHVPHTPGMHTPARSAPAFAGHTVPGNLARDGAPKHHENVALHGAMTEQQRALKGMGHMGTGPDASSPEPLDIERKSPKQLTPLSIHPSMHKPGRSNDWHRNMADAVMSDCTESGSSKLPKQEDCK